jgi:inward rectifier potassium channel
VSNQKIRLRPQESIGPKVRVVGQRWAPHEDGYHSVLTSTWWQFFLFVGLAFLGLNAVFALVYVSVPGAIGNARAGSFEDAFAFSVETMATIGYGTMTPQTRFGHAIVTLEALTSILSIALVTGATFAKFARPTARVIFTDKFVMGTRDGVPHVMFRMANYRHNNVVEAQLRVMLLVEEKTREGETMRRPNELTLVRDRTALFSLSWTAMHKVDESSPFYGEGALDKLRSQRAELVLSLTGLDVSFGQNIHARHFYTLDDLVKNARFKDILQVLPDGTRELDYAHFHEVVAIDTTTST